MKNTNIKIIVTTVLFTIAINVPVYSSLPYDYYTAECPTPLVRIWEPCAWQTIAYLGDVEVASVALFMMQRISGDNNQGPSGLGYQYDCYQDFALDTDFEGCTRSNWDNMANDTGIFVITGHGRKEGILGVTNTNETLLENWAGAELNNGMKTDDWAEAGGDICLIESATLGNWQSELLSNNALVLFMHCHGANYSTRGILPPLYYCYGKIGFGYEQAATISNTYHDTIELFDHMNGSEGYGYYREADLAYNNGSFNSIFKNKKSSSFSGLTLCPSVLDVVINPDCGDSFSLWDQTSGAGNEGNGFIQFDSHCITNTTPVQGLLVSQVTSGSLSIFDIEWEGDYKIIFKYSGSNNFHSILSVPAYCLLAAGGHQMLDGDWQAPNGDDFYVSFDY